MTGSKCQSTDLVPLRGKKLFGPRPHRILISFRGSFQNFRQSPLLLLYGRLPLPGVWSLLRKEIPTRNLRNLFGTWSTVKVSSSYKRPSCNDMWPHSCDLHANHVSRTAIKIKCIPPEACLIERSNTLYPDGLNKRMKFNHVSFSVVFFKIFPSVLL